LPAPPYRPPDPQDRRQPGYGQRPDHPGPRSAGYPPAQPPLPPGERERSGGAEGNERLTVLTGAVLLILLAVEGFTILRIGRLLTLHFFLGMLLLGPVALKAGSVIYRFFRYYAGSAPYRRRGPPAPLLRVLGPVNLLLTAAVFGSGIVLAVVGPSGEQRWLTVHRVSFILWFAAMAIHVLAYVPRLPGRLYAEARGVVLPPAGRPEGASDRRPAARAAQLLGGRGVRLSLLVASLGAGLLIALLTVHLANAWESPDRVFYKP
jgi:hypothetical protein